MYLANKIRLTMPVIVILIAFGTVNAQSQQFPGKQSPLKRITSKIHVPKAKSIPATGLRNLVNSVNGQDQLRTINATWYLESSQDTLFPLFPGSKISVSQFFYAYNTNDDSTKALYKIYNDTTGKFENSLLDEYTYDTSNNVTKNLTTIWNKGTGQFDNFSQLLYSYNASNLETEHYSQNWMNNGWVNSYKMITNYDSQNRETEIINQNWGASAWVNYDRTSYSYGQAMQPTLELFQNWDGSNWVNVDQYVYTINNNNISTEVYQVWMNGQWADSTKDIYSYDSNNRPSQMIEQIYRGGNWIDTTKTLFTYHSSSTALDFASMVEQAWDGANWVDQYQTVYTYNASNQVTEYLIQMWTGTDWMNNFRIRSTFDSNGNMVRMTTDYWLVASWSSFLSQTNTFTQSRPTEVPTPIERNGIASVPARFELLQNYPNPFNPSTVIQYKLAKTGMVRLTVYDLTGRQVATLVNRTQGSGSYLVRFNAAQLASGIYFYRLQTEEFSQIRKMLLIR